MCATRAPLDDRGQPIPDCSGVVPQSVLATTMYPYPLSNGETSKRRLSPDDIERRLSALSTKCDAAGLSSGDRRRLRRGAARTSRVVVDVAAVGGAEAAAARMTLLLFLLLSQSRAAAGGDSRAFFAAGVVSSWSGGTTRRGRRRAVRRRHGAAPGATERRSRRRRALVCSLRETAPPAVKRGVRRRAASAISTWPLGAMAMPCAVFRRRRREPTPSWPRSWRKSARWRSGYSRASAASGWRGSSFWLCSSTLWRAPAAAKGGCGCRLEAVYVVPVYALLLVGAAGRDPLVLRALVAGAVLSLVLIAAAGWPRVARRRASDSSGCRRRCWCWPIWRCSSRCSTASGWSTR